MVKPGGRIGLLHIAVPITPVGCQFITSFGVVPGPGFRIRAFTIYEKQQAGLLDLEEQDRRRAARPVKQKTKRRGSDVTHE